MRDVFKVEDGRAACEATDPEWWFPDFRGTAAKQQTVEHVGILRRICSGCPKRTPCRKLALDAEGGTAESGRWGVYGGWTPAQRTRIAQLLGLDVEDEVDELGDLFDLMGMGETA